MKYTSRNPNGINQITGSAVAVTVLNNDVAVFTTSSLELDGALTASSAIISGNVTVLGTASINTLIVNQTKYSSGSNQLGDAADDVQTLYGSVIIPTGSFNVTGSSIISGSLNVTGGITGSLFGTASYVPNLNEVTTAGNTTTNGVTVGNLQASNLRFGTAGATAITNTTGNVVLNVLSPGLSIAGSRIDPTARLHVKGSGTTSATTALRVENANTSASLVVLDNGFIGVGTGSAAYNLDVNGNANFAGYGLFSDVQTSNLNLDKLALYKAGSEYIVRGFSYTGQLSLLGGYLGNGGRLYLYGNTNTTGFGSVHTPSKFGIGVVNTSSAILSVAGNTTLSGSAGTGSALTVYKSGSTVVSIQGSQGELFSITDSLSGSLFSVSNISGLPILEVFSDNTVLLGSYLDPMLITTQRLTANSGSTVIYSLPTASYDGVFVDYVIRSGSNARAGQIMGLWSGSTAAYTDNSTTDFGSTAGFTFGLIISSSNMVLTGSASTSGWTVRAGIRSI
jgi:hypothetical protein